MKSYYVYDQKYLATVARICSNENLETYEDFKKWAGPRWLMGKGTLKTSEDDFKKVWNMMNNG